MGGACRASLERGLQPVDGATAILDQHIVLLGFLCTNGGHWNSGASVCYGGATERDLWVLGTYPIDRQIGWFDRIFASPSNHRVHHGSNEYCLDKNYGFTFIIWDRMFGTYAQERDDEPVVYGTLVPINSWNPLWANFKNYSEIVRSAFVTRGWRSKLMHVFGPPGWTPNGTANHPAQDALTSQKFETPSTRMERVYGVLAALAIMFFLGHLLASLTQLTIPQRAF